MISTAPRSFCTSVPRIRTRPAAGSARAFGVDVSQFGGLDSATGYRGAFVWVFRGEGWVVVYGGLGFAATSFAATFFVAPLFSESLKEPEEWRDIYPKLVAEKTESITPLSAQAKLTNPESDLKFGILVMYSLDRSVLLDVSLASRYEQNSAKGSINIPLYQPIQGWDLASFARRLAFAFFGIPGTERNPDWLESVKSKIPKDREVIVMCELGGTLEKKVGMDTGFQSRSLKAIYFLQEAGYQNVLHMKGGINEWIREGLPLEQT